MNYSAINIQGNIVSSEILEKVRTEDIRYQKAIDFGLNPSNSVRDEINLAWSIVVSNWNAFKSKREALNDSDTGTPETRRYWMLPLFQALGFEISSSNAEVIQGKSYAISHRASNKDGFPIHIVGVNQSLDKRAESGGTRLSPHALVQEYLNNTEHLFALVSNGRFLRVLRDATRLSRLSYLEFDLERIMEEGLYVEFALMFRVLHASRMPEKQDSGADCFLEFYHQEALASGSRIRERLSVAVEISIKGLANGLLKNPQNQELRDQVLNGQISSKDYYLYTLRLVYRMLFLLVIEERKLIYPDKRDEELNRKRSIYYDFYSVQRLTKLAEKLIYVDPRKTDLWQSLITTFALFEHEQYGKKLGISPLGAGIFSPNALGIISDQLLDNETLLRVLRYLVTFENEQGHRVRVNYADLDVEEFGSVYEGLLEYDPEITNKSGEPIFGFVKGDDRSSSGSHYTPEELVRPLIKHSLDYLIENKLKEADPEKGLLSLTICDVACGSGHILLSAARRVGFELAKVRSKEDQPTPSVLRLAVRDVIRHCIYGVDLNPLAVELCKVALWLEAHEPGQPLNFLDHHIKCGNAIVGLAHAEELEKGIASEAFKTLPGDDKDIASAFKKRNDLELKTSAQLSTFDLGNVDDELKDVQSDFLKFTQLPENTTDQIAKKEKAYNELTSGKKWYRLKNLADLQVAQFFIPKTIANKDKLTTHSQYITYLKQGSQILDRGASMAMSQDKRFFHWFLEFPEVFQNGGFDCILGNPPYLGGADISKNYGHAFMNRLYFDFFPARNRADLVVYFLRRDFDILSIDGILSLISTNSICEGDSREGGLEFLEQKKCQLLFVNKSIKWPGVANLSVSSFAISKSKIKDQVYLNNKSVKYISSYFEDEKNIGEPYTLYSNLNITYLGCKLLGEGFEIDKETYFPWLKIDEKNSDVLFPLLNGENLNSLSTFDDLRISINFKELDERTASSYIKPFEHVLNNVKPIRMLVNEEAPKKYWWKYARSRSELYSSLHKTDICIVWARTTKHFTPQIFSSSITFTDAICVSIIDKSFYLTLKSIIHEIWARKFSGTTEVRMRYSIEDAFNKFPLPNKLTVVDHHHIADNHDNYIKKIYSLLNLGMTKVYNQFNNRNLVVQLDPNEENTFEKKYGKETWNLYNHLEIKKEGNISFEEAVPLIFKLRELHKEMDQAVLQAYGWHQDDPKWGKAIQLRHDFYEVDYLPENDRVRYTIHPEARKEVLKRLLQLNHERYAEEVAAGLHDKKGGKKESKERKSNPSKKEDPKVSRPQPMLFQEAKPLAKEPAEIKSSPASKGKIISIGSVVKLKSKDGRIINIACGTRSSEAQSLKAESAFVQALVGKSVGEKVNFGNGFEVLEINNSF